MSGGGWWTKASVAWNNYNFGYVELSVYEDESSRHVDFACVASILPTWPIWSPIIDFMMYFVKWTETHAG